MPGLCGDNVDDHLDSKYTQDNPGVGCGSGDRYRSTLQGLRGDRIVGHVVVLRSYIDRLVSYILSLNDTQGISLVRNYGDQEPLNQPVTVIDLGAFYSATGIYWNSCYQGGPAPDS